MVAFTGLAAVEPEGVIQVNVFVSDEVAVIVLLVIEQVITELVADTERGGAIVFVETTTG